MKNSAQSLVVVLAISLVTIVGIRQSLGASDISQTVQRLNQKWDDALNAGKAGEVAALYAENARVVTGDGKIVQGREEIKELFQSFIDSGFHDHEIDMVSVEMKDDIAWEIGKWSGIGGDDKTYGGHLVNVYKRQGDGRWQVVLHIWN